MREKGRSLGHGLKAGSQKDIHQFKSTEEQNDQRFSWRGEGVRHRQDGLVVGWRWQECLVRLEMTREWASTDNWYALSFFRI